MKNKKLQFTSGSPKTPRLQIFKQPDGVYTITYAKSDPLGIRSETTADLDSEIKRLFGYSGWQEYKQENMTDLTKKVITDPGSGKVTQAPTLHPFHVAYGIEEFVTSFNPEDYEVVAIPAKSKLLKEVIDPVGILDQDPEADAARAEEEARKADREKNPQNKYGDVPSATDAKRLEILNGVIQQRRMFFGDVAGESSKEKLGILNIAAFFPQEQLANKEVLARAKNKFNFKDIFAGIFGEEVPVKHPSGKYWKSGFRVFQDTAEDVSDAHKVDASEILSSTSMLYEQAAPKLDVLPSGGAPKPNLRVVPSPTARPPAAFPGGKLPLTAANDNVIKKVAEGPAKKVIQQLPKILAKKAAAKGALAAVPFVGWALAAGLLIWDIYEITGWVIENWNDIKKWLAGVIGIESFTVLDNAINEAVPAMDPVPPLVTDLPDAGPVPVSPENVSPTPGVGPVPAPVPLPVPAPVSPPLVGPAVDIPPGGTGLWPPLLPVLPGDLNYHIVPVGWEGGKWLTTAEDVLSQRVGANTDFSFGSAPVKDDKPEDDKKQVAGTIKEGSRALIFGHSQTGRYGRKIKTEFEASGGKVPRIHVHSSNQDGFVKEKFPGLVNHIKKIKGQYTHAFLFLGGNTGKKDHFKAKKEIIRYVIEDLNVPKENIVVILPPINLDKQWSKKRGEELYDRAQVFFNSIGIKVHPKVVGKSKDFSKDGLHIKSTSGLVSGAASGLVAGFSSAPSGPTEQEPQVVKPFSGKPPKEQVANIIVSEARKAGVDPLLALTIAKIESGLNPLSNIDKEGPYKGLYQFGRQYRNEWQEKYGLNWEKVHDAKHAAAAFMRVIKDKVSDFRNSGIIKRSTAANVDPSEAYLIYLSWQQGSYGTKTIYRAAQSGRPVPERIQKNMDNNTYPKTKNISPQAFIKMWQGKMSRFMSRAGREYARALQTRTAISETKGLTNLFNIIKETSNDLVQKKI